MPKEMRNGRESQHHQPLLQQMTSDQHVVQKTRKQQKPKTTANTVLDNNASRKIMNLVSMQQREIQDELENGKDEMDNGMENQVVANISSDEDEEETAFPSDNEEETEDDYMQWQQSTSSLNIDAQDAHLLEKFMGKSRQKVNLSDMIQSQLSTVDQPFQPPPMNPKVIEVYTKVGLLLSRYKSGPLPKTFKIIPTLRDWEQVLYITNPEAWTPQAMFAATRIFTSNLKSKMAQRFFSLILLERVRDDIAASKKLNYHLYMAVKKSLYKPAAFFKGLLLPLCESGSCTLREAAILASVLIKVSIPLLHSAAALLKLTQMPYTGPISLFIRILLDKKYALPFKVIDALVFHFLSFRTENREDLAVLWHQSLLVFAQRYKEDLTVEQKVALVELVRVCGHEGIGPETRRELVHSVCRGGDAAIETEPL